MTDSNSNPISQNTGWFSCPQVAKAGRPLLIIAEEVEGEARVKAIRAQTEEADQRRSSDYDREKFQDRVAKLAGGVAVICGSARRIARNPCSCGRRHRHWGCVALLRAQPTSRLRAKTQSRKQVSRSFFAPSKSLIFHMSALVFSNACEEPSVVVNNVLTGKGTTVTTQPHAIVLKTVLRKLKLSNLLEKGKLTPPTFSEHSDELNFQP
jgi:hypothetical protein